MFAAERIGERLARRHRLSLCGVDELAEDGGSRAGPGDRHSSRHELVDGILDGGPLPVVHVVRLVAAGDEQRLGVADCLAARTDPKDAARFFSTSVSTESNGARSKTYWL